MTFTPQWRQCCCYQLFTAFLIKQLMRHGNTQFATRNLCNNGDCNRACGTGSCLWTDLQRATNNAGSGHGGGDWGVQHAAQLNCEDGCYNSDERGGSRHPRHGRRRRKRRWYQGHRGDEGLSQVNEFYSLFQRVSSSAPTTTTENEILSKRGSVLRARAFEGLSVVGNFKSPCCCARQRWLRHLSRANCTTTFHFTWMAIKETLLVVKPHLFASNGQLSVKQLGHVHHRPMKERVGRKHSVGGR